MSRRALERRLGRSYTGYIGSSLDVTTATPPSPTTAACFFVSLAKVKTWGIRRLTKHPRQHNAHRHFTGSGQPSSGSRPVGLRLRRSTAWQMAFSGRFELSVSCPFPSVLFTHHREYGETSKLTSLPGRISRFRVLFRSSKASRRGSRPLSDASRRCAAWVNVQASIQ